MDRRPGCWGGPRGRVSARRDRVAGALRELLRSGVAVGRRRRDGSAREPRALHSEEDLMGLIARRWAAQEEVRNLADWLNDDDTWSGRLTTAGVRVTQSVALGLTTIWRCVDLLSSAVSQAPKDVILKIGGKSYPEHTKPGWLLNPNPLNPNYTASDYFGLVALSLLLDGNYFTHVYPHVFDPQVLTVLPPSLVDVKSGGLYDLRDENGHVVQKDMGPSEILHGVWIRPAGSRRGISPLEALRRSVGSAVAAEDHAARFFGQGAA